MTSIAALAGIWRGGPLRTAAIVVAAIAVAACLVAAWFGLSWLRAAQDESIELGIVRDTVLQDAQQAAINVNTLDHRRVQGGFELWEQSATGAALREFKANREAYVRTVTEAKTTSTARVRDAAVAELDDRAGTALVLVGADVTYTPQQGEPSCVRQRLLLNMRRTPEAWKVAKIAPVGVLDPVPGACPAAEPPAGPPK
ncbi:MAG TPA: hypothetical protein VHH34_17600 [Pseudonocardiaceae bacterium]|nr:hypothetical protein [Pseudonocardiaceae bacterium]